MNKATGKGKYSRTPHPLLRLSKSALPAGCSKAEVEKAIALFSGAVTQGTQSNYATAVRHLGKAEKKYGRKFVLPMSEKDKTLFTVYLCGLGIRKVSVENYLSALQYYQMSQGVANPQGNSGLGRRLMKGGENLSRNPWLEAVKMETPNYGSDAETAGS